jgi:hypothetical protein
MTTTFDTRIRRTVGLLVAATAIVLVGATSALAGGRPASSYYTKQQLETMSQSWAAKAALSSLSPTERKVVLQTVAGVGTASSAAAGSAASHYTKQQLETMSQSWAARAAIGSLSPSERKALLQSVGTNTVSGTDEGRPAASYYTKQQLEAMSQRWALRGALSAMTVSDRKALLQAMQTPSATTSGSGGLDWGDFGIGAAGMFGLVLLVGGAFLAVHYGRRSSGAPAHTIT